MNLDPQIFHLKMQLSNFFIMNGAYFTIACLLVWLVCVFRFYGRTIFRSLKGNLIGIVFCLVSAGLVFSTAHVGFRIFSDETNLLSVSENIARHMQSLNSIQGYFMPDGEYVAITSEVPTRPLVFPVLTAGLHRLVGVQPGNVFVLNFVLFFLFLLTVYLLFERLSLWLRCLLVLTLAFNPALAIHAATGGFDLCSLLFGLWTFIALWVYLKKPESSSLMNLGLATLCFVQVRYESLVILPFLFFIICLYRRKGLGSDLRGQWFLIFSPLLLLPALAQRIVTWGRFENPPGIPAFSVQNIPLHLPEVIGQLFFKWDGPYPWLLDLLGVVGLVFLLWMPKDRKEKYFLGSLIAYGSFLSLLLLAHYMGIAESSTQIRLFMPLTVFLFMALAYGLMQKKWQRVLLAFCCLIQLLLGAKYIKEDPLMENLAMAMETKELRVFLKAQNFDHPIFIYRRPGQLISLGYSSVLPSFYQQNSELLKGLVQNKVAGKIYEIISRPMENPGPMPYEPLPGWKRELKQDIPVTLRFKLQFFELMPDPAPER